MWTVSRWVLLFVTPYVVLTLAGGLLWKRSHTVAAGMVAVGFAMALLGQLAALWEGLTAFRAAGDTHTSDPTFVFPWLTHYVGEAGFWVAAVGLLWHVSRKR
jgi:putative alpha-1,2-mannosidase